MDLAGAGFKISPAFLHKDASRGVRCQHKDVWRSLVSVVNIRMSSEAWHPLFILTADIHDDDIRTNLFNIFIRDTDIRLGAKDIKEFIAAVDKYFADLSAALVKFQIRNSP